MPKCDTLANSFSLSVSLVSSLLLSSAVQNSEEKVQVSTGNNSKVTIVPRQRAVTNHWQNLVCIALPSTMEDKIVCQLHFHCQGSLSGKAQSEKQLRSSGRHMRDLKLIPIVKQMGGNRFFARRIDSLRHRVHRHTEEISHTFRKFFTLYPISLSSLSSILVTTFVPSAEIL